MKKLTFLIVLSFIIQATALSQPCLPEGITFTTQAEIDNFQTNYPNCTEIEGDVEINGDDITNLNGLSVLTSIGGFLSIEYNNTLTSLSGLDNVTSIGGFLWIIYNAALTSLTGLDNLTTIEGYLDIFGNAALTSLTSLNNVTFIGGYLSIGYNAALTSLTGLNNVTSIGGCLWIGFNNALTSLTGLDNVISIGGALYIHYNAALTSLTGLENIDANSISYLFIIYNNFLATCAVQSICDYLASPNGEIEIYNNATGCNSQEEVEEACEALCIPNINVKSEFLIYPNPAKKEIYISVKNGTIIKEVNIYNQIGQKVLHENRITNTIDVSTLRQGMYIIEFVTNDSKIREKLIIK